MFLNKKTVIFIFTIVVFSFIAFISINTFNKLSYNYFYKGIFIDGVNVSGLTKEQAMERLQSERSRIHYDQNIILKYNNKIWILPLKNLNYQFDLETTINNAYKIGREGTRLDRLKTIKSIEKTPINLILSVNYNNEKLTNMLLKIKKEIDFLAKSSTYNYNYGRIMYTSDIEGRNFDIEENRRLIASHLMNRNYCEITLIVSPVRPAITLEDVKYIKDVLASFTTTFNKNNYNRSHNIELACKKINNYLLKPGEEFSMNSVLGPRTSQNGYMEAPIILKSSMVQGTGGGVCQVASTLYNSVLMSVLQVISRVNHSIPPAYVPPSQDATIAEGYIDFRFKNNRDYTICIAADVRDNTVNIKIIGRKRDDDPYVVLKPVIVAEYDPPEPKYVVDNSLPDNQQVVVKKGKKGMKVILYREIYNKKGSLINSEIISEDIYKPIRGEIAINKKTYELFKN